LFRLVARPDPEPAFVIAALWKNDLRHYLIVLNAVVAIGLVAYLVRANLSPKRARSEEKLPANIEEFLPDEDLEGRRLERVQGWALIFAAIVAVSLPVYWLREPARQDESIDYFDENAVERGATLFANSASEAYNSATSLQCANCHGQEGVGGVARQAVDGVSVPWRAPALNTVLLRMTEDPQCANEAQAQHARCEVSEVITYGRPGTPMQPWGVAGGGPKNFQAVADLVAYLRTIQLSPEEVQKAEAEAIKAARSTDPEDQCPAYLSCPAIEVANAREKSDAADKALDKARSDVREKLKDATATDDALVTDCNDISDQADKDAASVDRDSALACGDFLAARDDAESARAALAWSLEWQRRRANVSDGQLLFELNCARCHTEGWSVFDPTVPPPGVNSVNVLGLAGGGGGEGGGIGFNLRDGATERRFGTDEDDGWRSQHTFIENGSDRNAQYGRGGVGSGRMPGFLKMLTSDQISQIVSYERYCLSQTDYRAVSPACEAGTQAKTAPTSTTIAGGSK
jgi:mono/diheme cytochrome c family protein